MITKRLLWLDIKKIHSSWFTYFSLLLSIFPAYGMVYAIKNLHGPFTILHVTSFYSLFGSIFCVILSMRLFTDDIYHEVFSLIFDKVAHRKRYLVGKLLGSIYVGILFGLICMFVIFTSVEYLRIHVDNHIYLKSFLNYILFSAFYSLLFFFISIFYRKVTVLFVIAVLSVSFLPNLIASILESGIFSKGVIHFVHDVPFYFLPIRIGSHNFSNVDYIIVLFSIVLLFFLSIKAIIRQDY